MKLEKMDAFFTARLNGYDEHMMAEIEGAKEFYPYTAALLPLEHDVNVLDLGCGTGLEPTAFYHYDTPLTVEHETEVLKKAGFLDVRIMRNWKSTYTIFARRQLSAWRVVF